MGWEVSDCTLAVLLGDAFKICSKQHAASLCSSPIYIYMYDSGLKMSLVEKFKMISYQLLMSFLIHEFNDCNTDGRSG